MSLDYVQLATLAAVVREGSFERAARLLHITPSAVSQRIRLLEERMGCVLVVRGQPCEVTEAGRPLVQHAEHVALLEADLAAATAVRGVPSGVAPVRPTLRIAVNADSLGTWFVQALAEFAHAQPGVAVDLLLDDQDHTGDALRRGEVVAAVTAAAEPVQGASSVALGRMRYLATASPAFMRRWFPHGVDGDSLSQAPCLVFSRKDRLQERWLRRVTRREITPLSHGLPGTQAFVDGALAGLGWGMNPEGLVAEHVSAGRLVELVPGRTIDVPLHWQALRLRLPALSALGDAVRRVARRQLR